MQLISPVTRALPFSSFPSWRAVHDTRGSRGCSWGWKGAMYQEAAASELLDRSKSCLWGATSSWFEWFGCSQSSMSRCSGRQHLSVLLVTSDPWELMTHFWSLSISGDCINWNLLTQRSSFSAGKPPSHFLCMDLLGFKDVWVCT